jgi:hypothetical protein
LVSDLRTKGHVFNCEIALALGNQTYHLHFSGASLNEEVVLTAYVAASSGKSAASTKSKQMNASFNLHQMTDDVILMEELNQLSKQILNNPGN